MVLEKLLVSANFTQVSESRRHKLESQNLVLAKCKAELGILNLEFEFRKPSERTVIRHTKTRCNEAKW